MSRLSFKLILALFFLMGLMGLSEAEAATLSVSPSSQTLQPQQEAKIEVVAKEASGITAFQFDFTYDGNILELQEASLSPGILATKLGPLFKDLDNNKRSIKIGAYVIGGAILSDNLSHSLVTIRFKAKNQEGVSQLTLSEAVLIDPQANKMSVACENGAITVLGPPSLPSNLTAKAVSSTQINLTWQDNSNNEDGFKIERKVGASGTFSQIATVGANTTTYRNTRLTQGRTYYYRVRAYNKAGNSGYSNEAYVSLTAPAKPSNLVATAVSSRQINLSWKDNSTNETGFKIERKTTASGTFSQIATVGANTTTYRNTGLSSKTTYYYRLRAYNAVGNSGYSNTASAKTKK